MEIRVNNLLIKILEIFNKNLIKCNKLIIITMLKVSELLKEKVRVNQFKLKIILIYIALKLTTKILTKPE